MSKKVYIVVGEASGDILASRLMIALQKKLPDVQFFGMGGETMTALGFKSLFDIAEISVMGIWEVIPRLPRILKRLKQVQADIASIRPDLIVTVDSWGFVSNLLKKLQRKKSTVPVIHYVAPQVWAWKKGRAKQVARLVNRLMTLLPNEPPYFEKYGLHCDFVGHPVMESVASCPPDVAAFKQQQGIPDDCTLLCVLPGSRQSEIKRLIPVFKGAVSSLAVHYPNLFIVIPSVAAMADKIKTAFEGFAVPHCVVVGQNERYQAFRAGCFAIAASGTVSLELAACRTPHVIAYTFSAFTNWLVNILITEGNLGNLINILENQTEIVPEFTIEDCKEEKIYNKVYQLLQHPDEAQTRVEQAFATLQKLTPHNTLPSQNAAEVVFEVLMKGR
ncbi:lipid-A-disaccharide synthase [Bacteroidia bacterium]|nr:lipid-A-disaccharide synthase [Bacteroidia bacterium]